MVKQDFELLLTIPGGKDFINTFIARSDDDSTFSVIISTKDIKDKLVEVMMFNGKSITEFGKITGRTDFYYVKDITEFKLPTLSVA